MQPAVQADRRDHRRGVRRRRAAVDAGVPDVAGGEDRAGGRSGERRRAAGRRDGVARRVAGIGPGRDLHAVAIPVAIGVGPVRVGPEGLLREVSQAVPVAVLARIGDPVAVGVLLARVEDRSELAPVPETVRVGILEVVPLAVAVRVLGMRARTGRVLLLVRQSVVIGVLGPVRDAVTVGVAPRRAGPRPVALVGVRQAIGIAVGAGCRGYARRPDGRHDDERHECDGSNGGAGPRHVGSVGQRQVRWHRTKVRVGRDLAPVPRGNGASRRSAAPGRPGALSRETPPDRARSAPWPRAPHPRHPLAGATNTDTARRRGPWRPASRGAGGRYRP